MENSEAEGRSLMCIKISKRLSEEPCGTPQVTFDKLDSQLLIGENWDTSFLSYTFRVISLRMTLSFSVFIPAADCKQCRSNERNHLSYE